MGYSDRGKQAWRGDADGGANVTCAVGVCILGMTCSSVVKLADGTVWARANEAGVRCCRSGMVKFDFSRPIIRGNGYDGVCALIIGVSLARTVFADSVEAVGRSSSLDLRSRWSLRCDVTEALEGEITGKAPGIEESAGHGADADADSKSDSVVDTEVDTDSAVGDVEEEAIAGI